MGCQKKAQFGVRAMPQYAVTTCFRRQTLLVLSACLVHSVFAFENGRHGEIHFSDGGRIEGNISMTPGRKLVMHQGKVLRQMALDRVKEIRLRPETEKMAKKWRFVTAGQTHTEQWGKPYPVRDLRATIVLHDGEQIMGHLYTTVLYVRQDGEAKKVVVSAKQRGKEGENFESLVYPTRVCFSGTAEETESVIRMIVRHGCAGPGTRIVALTWGALNRLEARPGEKPDAYTLPSPFGENVFLAARSGDEITVGWQQEGNEQIERLIAAALVQARDFFDERALLGVFYDKAFEDVYSLLLLSRKGPTTLNRPLDRPWRVAVWRWKYDPEVNSVMLAGRGFFFRGLKAVGGPAPRVLLSEQLWNVRKVSGVWIVGEEE